MAPTTCWAAGAGPELGAQHADGGGAVPQLRHPRRCHGASGPGRSHLEGPPLGVGLPPHWAASPGAHSGRERGLGLLGSARSRSPAFPLSPGTRVQPRRRSHFPDCDEMESFPPGIQIVGSGGRSCERSRKSRTRGLCKAHARPCRPGLDRSWRRRRRSFPARLGACRAPICGRRWRRGGSFVLSPTPPHPPASRDARGKDRRFVFLSGRIL